MANVKMRSMYDTDAVRQSIYDGILDSVSKRFPLEDDDYRLDLVNPRYTGPTDFTMSQQKKALMTNRRLTTPISGTWRLTHKPTNKVLEEREDVVMSVPYYTPRGTIINNGNEYSIPSQSRLRPGAYVRKQRTGEIETHFNVEPGSGRGMRLHLRPETGEFLVNVGSANIPLYSLLNAMGVSDKELVNTWGADLTATNAKKHNSQNLGKLYQRFAGYKAVEGADDATMAAYLRDELPKYKVDPEVMARTLGMPDAKGISKEVLLRATQKMLGVSRGEENPDDRDGNQYARVYSVDDLLRERIDKDAGRLTWNIMHRIRRNKGLKSLQYGALNPYIDNFILGSGLAMPLEETNPLSTLEQMTRITKLGEGGIGSSEAITDEARDVNPSQFGFIDPVAGPESGNIGVDVRAAHGVMKGNDNKLYANMLDLRSGKYKPVSPDMAADATVAFPGQDLSKLRVALAMKDGKVQRVATKEIDYQVPSFSNMFSSHANLNPMPTAVQPGRQFYALKFWSQYLPQHKGEVPLVDSLTDDGKTTFSEFFGRMAGTLQSKVNGTVTKVNDTGVTVTDSEGKKHFYETVKNFPFNRISGITYTPTVEQGQAIKAGDMLAHSSFTDSKTGALNLGQNLRAAIIPYRGKSYEDAVVISESASKKLSTERLYGYDADTRNGVEISKRRFMSAFPDKFNKDQIETLDDNGIVKEGTILNRGDPIVAAVGPKLLTSADAQLGKLHKVLRNSFTDKSQTWEYDYPGEVVDAAKLRSGAKVNIKSVQPVAPGDKLSTRFGLKGVVGHVIPDDKMPRNIATNEPYELLLNPMAVLSRVAPNQIMEMSLGKIARKTGKQVRLPQLPPEGGWARWTMQQLKDANVTESSDLFDPETGKTIKNVGDGSIYMAAFHHLADKKLSSRGEVGTYTADDQPAKGGTTGSKRFSNLDVNAALAHSAVDVIKDVITVRGTRNEEFWKALKLGRPLPEPEVPFIYNKFLNTLRAGGINVVEKGDITSIMPMTDDDIINNSSGAIDSSSMLDDGLNPIAGGLFDAGRTGGTAGKRWTHIKLPEPVPNPVMEEPIRRMLGLTVKKMEAILAGEEELDGKVGGGAIKAALEKIDIDATINENKDKVRILRGSNRDNAVKVLGYLDGAKKQGTHPSKWMVSNVPVLPPVFRPISKLGDVALVADINELYRDVIENAEAYKTMKGRIPDKDLAAERLNIYKSVQAAFGLGDPITPEGQSKRIKGAIRQVIGTRPKTGMFQSKVISKTVDAVGRGVVTPDPNLSMDQIGIPENSAWELYKNFVIRNLVQRGYPTVTALELIDQKHPTAKAMLEDVMSKRPVILDRAPTWHKFNLLAFKPHLTDGDVIRVSPLVTKGFNMDFDGDFQINRVAVFFTEAALKVLKIVIKNENTILPWGTVLWYNGNMKDLIVPTQIGGALIAVDLDNFPHGKLSNHVDGANGPIDFYHAIPGTKVIAFDESGSLVWADVKYWSKHYHRATELVTLSDKRQIITDDDPRAVYGVDPKLGTLELVRDTPTNALARGLIVPVAQNTRNLFSQCSIINSIDITTTAVPYRTQKLTREFGWFLGAMAGDGWWDRKDYSLKWYKTAGVSRALHLADHVGCNHAGVLAFLRTINDTITVNKVSARKVDSPARYGDSTKYTYMFKDCEAFTEFLSEHLGGERDDTTTGSGNKRLPNFAFTAPREFRLGMLCGLIDTDGTVSNISRTVVSSQEDQLKISFTSTSLRLVRDMQLLCRTLDIRAIITTSKHNGKPNWVLSLSSPDCKRENALAGLQHPVKLKSYKEGNVDIARRMYDTIVIPEYIIKHLQRGLDLSTPRTELYGKEQFASYMTLNNAKSSGYVIPRKALMLAVARIEAAYTVRGDKLRKRVQDAIAITTNLVARQCTLGQEDRRAILAGLTACVPPHGAPELNKQRLTLSARMRKWQHTGRVAVPTDMEIVDWLRRQTIAHDNVLEHPDVKLYLDFIADSSVAWAYVSAVDKTGIYEDGYDLTVPGYETFTAISGVVLSNTANFHVPVSDKAVEQANKRMLPSDNLFSLTDLKSARHTPTMEMTMGLYWLTRGANKRKVVRRFSSTSEAEKAYRNGELGVNDPIEIIG